jgi:chemotaxis protein methyltransferase CheR
MQAEAREFDFTDRDFNAIQKLMADRTGIALGDGKRDLVYGRLARRLRKLRLDRFSDYLALASREGSEELRELINALTTNVTSFFREPHQFERLAEEILPGFEETLSQERRLRIWSAGCSTGPEPYSIAMVLCESALAGSGWDAKILATDLDSQVLETARTGVYREDDLRGISRERVRRFFRRGTGAQAGHAKVTRELTERVHFAQLNLLEPWPMRGPFDVIFCRNVVIYFTKDTQRELFDRYANLLRPGGVLCIGHSESLLGVTTRFESLGGNVYRRLS